MNAHGTIRRRLLAGTGAAKIGTSPACSCPPSRLAPESRRLPTAATKATPPQRNTASCNALCRLFGVINYACLREDRPAIQICSDVMGRRAHKAAAAGARQSN